MFSMLGAFWPVDWPFLLAAAIGASSTGYLFAGCFGHSGSQGIGLCVLGAVLTTISGAAVAGLGLGLVLAQTPAGLIMGPIAVAQALVTSPVAALTWAGSMVLAHLAMRGVRSGLTLPS